MQIAQTAVSTCDKHACTPTAKTLTIIIFCRGHADPPVQFCGQEVKITMSSGNIVKVFASHQYYGLLLLITIIINVSINVIYTIINVINTIIIYVIINVQIPYYNVHKLEYSETTPLITLEMANIELSALSLVRQPRGMFVCLFVCLFF